MTPQAAIERVEQLAAGLPGGEADRFAGYGVMGLTFRTGHVLALRSFRESSVGPAFSSVWHRSPAGRWTFYSTVAPDLGCARYFGRGIDRHVVAPIEIQWLDDARFHVSVGRTIEWSVRLEATPATRLLGFAARRLPDSWSRTPTLLRAMGTAARVSLGAGGLNLTGQTPNGQQFTAQPRHLWLIRSSNAIVDGIDAGDVGPLTSQASLGDFLIPQTGLFVVGGVHMDWRQSRAA